MYTLYRKGFLYKGMTVVSDKNIIPDASDSDFVEVPIMLYTDFIADCNEEASLMGDEDF